MALEVRVDERGRRAETTDSEERREVERRVRADERHDVALLDAVAREHVGDLRRLVVEGPPRVPLVAHLERESERVDARVLENDLDETRVVLALGAPDPRQRVPRAAFGMSPNSVFRASRNPAEARFRPESPSKAPLMAQMGLPSSAPTNHSSPTTDDISPR